MKKIIALFILLSISLSSAFAFTSEKTSKQENLNEIFELINAEQEPSQFKSLNEANKYTEEYDKAVLERFNKLSVSEKYEIIRMTQELNNPQNKERVLNYAEIVINDIMKDLESQDILFGI